MEETEEQNATSTIQNSKSLLKDEHFLTSSLEKNMLSRLFLRVIVRLILRTRLPKSHLQSRI